MCNNFEKPNFALILKNLCNIWNKHSRTCPYVKFYATIKILKCVIKMPYLVFFGCKFGKLLSNLKSVPSNFSKKKFLANALNFDMGSLFLKVQGCFFWGFGSRSRTGLSMPSSSKNCWPLYRFYQTYQKCNVKLSNLSLTFFHHSHIVSCIINMYLYFY